MERACSKKKYANHEPGVEEVLKSLIAKTTSSYQTYQQSREIGQLHDAIGYAREGCELAVQNQDCYTWYLNIIAILLHIRYERNRETEDLEEAIASARRAVQFTLPDHPNLLVYLHNLENSLGARYERDVDM